MVEDRRGGYLGGYMCLSETCPAGQPTPSAPTPGEDWEDALTAHMKTTWILGPDERKAALVEFIRNLLSSHASKAREEGRREGAEDAVKAVEKAKCYSNDCSTTCCRYKIMSALSTLKDKLKPKEKGV